MTLATVEPDGRPSARMVICRGLDVRAGWLVFSTDRESNKGSALEINPRAALVFNWDAHERQVRIEGPVTLAPDADSDAYWSSRPPDARAAAASNQSRLLASRAEFLARIEAEKRAGGDIPRLKRCGGYRVWAERVELWVGQPARAHDRVLWTRALTAADNGFGGEAVGLIAGPVVSHDSGHAHTQPPQAAHRPTQEADGDSPALVGQDLADGQTREIIGRHVRKLPSGAVHGVTPIVGHAMTGAHNPPEFLGIQMQQLARHGPLAAARTSPPRPHYGSWTSRTRRVLGDNGQEQSEVGRTPA